VALRPRATVANGSRTLYTDTLSIDGTGALGARDVDLSGADIGVTIDLGVGAERASVRTTDLSHGYVEENSAYSS